MAFPSQQKHLLFIYYVSGMLIGVRIAPISLVLSVFSDHIVTVCLYQSFLYIFLLHWRFSVLKDLHYLANICTPVII